MENPEGVEIRHKYPACRNCPCAKAAIDVVKSLAKDEKRNTEMNRISVNCIAVNGSSITEAMVLMQDPKTHTRTDGNDIGPYRNYTVISTPQLRGIPPKNCPELK